MRAGALMCPTLPSPKRLRHPQRAGGAQPPAGPVTDTAAPNTWDWRPPVERECPRCGTRMAEQKCKLTCPKCGATADCSDP